MTFSAKSLCRQAAALFVLVAAVLVFGAFAGGTGAATSPFVAVDLGTLGGAASSAAAVNDSGQVVGNSTTAGGEQHAFSWTQQGGMVDLGTLGGTSSFAVAVNDSGQVVGNSTTAGGEQHAFSWTQQGGMVDLGTLGASLNGAVAVNDSGQVVGNSTTTGGEQHAFSWMERGGMVDLGTLGGSSSEARALNDSGEVVGDSSTGDFFSQRIHAFLWTRQGGMVDLGGSPSGSDGLSFAFAVNSGGQVVGQYNPNSTTPARAFSWTQQGGMVDLGGSFSGARAVNDSGQVVGASNTGIAAFPNSAFSWTQQGGMVDLGTLGGSLSGAVAVNDSGQVVGNSTTTGGEQHAFSWMERGGMVDLGTLGGSSSEARALNDSGWVVGTAYTAGNAEHHAVLWQLSAGDDTTAPVITVPGPITVNATSPSGAVVTYSVSATDPDDTVASLVCVPASAGTFPVATTTVSCSASDAHGNTSSASFTVHVKGAAEQLAALQVAVTGFGPGKSLADKLTQTQDYVAVNDKTDACGSLSAFVNQVNAQTGKKIAAAQANSLIAQAKNIIGVLGC